MVVSIFCWFLMLFLEGHWRGQDGGACRCADTPPRRSKHWRRRSPGSCTWAQGAHGGARQAPKGMTNNSTWQGGSKSLGWNWMFIFWRYGMRIDWIGDDLFPYVLMCYLRTSWQKIATLLLFFWEYASREPYLSPIHGAGIVYLHECLFLGQMYLKLVACWTPGNSMSLCHLDVH